MYSTLEYVLLGVRGSCVYIPSYQVPRPLLPKAPGLITLIHWWEAQGVFHWRLGSCPESMREAGWSDKWQHHACPHLS
jgi:hypothetical protein